MKNLNFGPATKGDLIVVTSGRPGLERAARAIVEDMRERALAAISSGAAAPRDDYELLENARAELSRRFPDGKPEQMEMEDLHEPFSNRALNLYRRA